MRKFERFRELPKCDTETWSEQMLLEKRHWLTCSTQGCHKPLMCKKCIICEGPRSEMGLYSINTSYHYNGDFVSEIFILTVLEWSYKIFPGLHHGCFTSFSFQTKPGEKKFQTKQQKGCGETESSAPRGHSAALELCPYTARDIPFPCQRPWGKFVF